MGTIAEAFVETFRDYVTDGVPASGAHKPEKSETRALGSLIEGALGVLSLGGVDVTKDTRANLNADLAWAADSIALVYADSTDANNDLYLKVGGSGAGSWTLTPILHDIVEGLFAPHIALAQEWAESPEDDEIPGNPGKYSALHWAAKSEVAASTPVPPERTTFIGAGKNLFNQDTALPGYFVANAGGAPVANVDLACSLFIRVEPSTQYYGAGNAAGFRFVAGYDADQTWEESLVNSAPASVMTFSTGANTHFVRITIQIGDLATFQLEEGSSATAYEAFRYKLEGANGEPFVTHLLDGQVDDDALALGAVSILKTDFIQPGTNRFNKDTGLPGYYVAHTGGAPVANVSLACSDFIAVEPATAYHGEGNAAGMRFAAGYDANQVWVEALVNDAGAADKDFTTGANTHFVRVTFQIGDFDTFQLEEGAARSPYEAFSYLAESPDGYGIEAHKVRSRWWRKTCGGLGDSVTSQGRWQAAMIALTGLAYTNYGVSGSRLTGSPGDANAMCQDTRINALPTTLDMIQIMAGLNDWINDVALGTISSTNPLEFYGAWNTFMAKAMARWPAKRLVLITNTYAEVILPQTGWTVKDANPSGLTTRDYAAATVAIGKKWGVPVIDLCSRCGWNALNIATYVENDGEYLHPLAATGGATMGALVGSELNLLPLPVA